MAILAPDCVPINFGRLFAHAREIVASLNTLGIHRNDKVVIVHPVVEVYGMTEASHRMACNPLPPAIRKPGSVGMATGTETAIMEAGGARLLALGEVGEIVVRCPNVMHGYANRSRTKPLRPAGPAPQVWAASMPMAIFSLKATSRRSSIAAGKRSRLGKGKRFCVRSQQLPPFRGRSLVG